jgi:HlyD family secretion protein
MRIGRTWIFLLGIVLLVGLFGAYRLRSGSDTQHFTAKAERGDIADVVEATGTVNAVVTVQVGSQVSGTISKLNADFNSLVHTGDVIALIDPSLFQGALLQATADLESARSNVQATEASLVKARATLVQAKADFERTSALARGNLASPQELDAAKAAFAVAEASVDVADANLTQARAQVSQKAAAQSVARTNLDHTVIRSPIDGTVVARNVDVGQTVAASLQAPTIFTIAQDLTKMRVYAKTDESDVGSLKLGQPVTFKVDAFPKERFTGSLTQIRMNPTMVQNVVTYDAIVDFDNVGMRLFPGMTAYVSMSVATVSNVLKLPNAALRYKPPMEPDEVVALYKKYGIEPGEAAADGSLSGKSGRRAETAIVWKLRADSSIEPLKVALGITDHAFTEVTSVLAGQLKAGDELLTRSVTSKAQAPTGQGVRR